MSRPQKRRDDESPSHYRPLREVHCDGSARSIAFAKLGDGANPAKDFCDNLDDGDKDKFDALFLVMCQHGKISNPEKFRPRIGEIKCNHEGVTTKYPVAEFKIHTGTGKMFLAILDGRQFVL